MANSDRERIIPWSEWESWGRQSGHDYMPVSLYVAGDVQLRDDSGEIPGLPYVPGAEYKKVRDLYQLPAWQTVFGRLCAETQAAFNARQIEEALRRTLDAGELALKHIIVGVQEADGKPWQRLGYFADGYPGRG